MKTDSIRIAAADLLLDRGVLFTITDAPFLYRLLRINKIRIRALRAGTIIELDRILHARGLVDCRVDDDAMLDRLDAVALLIATAILNGRLRIRMFAPLLARMLLWGLPAKAMYKIFAEIARMNTIKDFTTITAFFCLQTSLLMNRKNTGQAAEGSHEAIPMASIALSAPSGR